MKGALTRGIVRTLRIGDGGRGGKGSLHGFVEIKSVGGQVEVLKLASNGSSWTSITIRIIGGNNGASG